MRRFLFIITLSMLFCRAQAAELSGKIADQKTKQPIEFANIALFEADGSTLTKGTTTDLQGYFVLQNIKTGKYTLKVSFIGYTSIEIPINITEKKPVINLGTLMIAEDSKTLKEVKVVGQRSQMKFEIDKKVFSVDQIIASAGGSASEALQNIPSVSVDNEGAVSLRNNPNVVIWINGRPSGLSEENRAQILEQMPAESIESIEVITNPSAKFSPEGSAGIINLVLKKNRKVGYYGSFAGGANTLGGYNAAANINYNTNKIDAFASVGVRSMRGESDSYTERQSWTSSPRSADTTKLYQKTNGNMDGTGIFVRGGLNYNVSKKDVIGLTFMGMLADRDFNSDVSSVLTPPSFIEEATKRISKQTMNHDMIEAAINYQHDFKPGSQIRFTGSVDLMNRDSKSTYFQSVLKPAISNKANEWAQVQEGDNGGNRYEVQVDYETKLNDKFKLEAGYKGNLNTSQNNQTTKQGVSFDKVIPYPELTNKFNYDENIQALYSTFSGKIKNLSFQGGLRAEYTDYTATTEGEPSFSRNYFKLFPSAFVSYSLPKGNELQLNYTRRINRPRGRQLNSFRDISDSTNISFGNPRLMPEYTNALELNYIKNWEQHTLSTSLYHRSTDNVIQSVRFVEGKTMFTTYENITKNQQTGAEIVSKNKLAKFLDLTTTINLYYYKLNGFEYSYKDSHNILQTRSYRGDESFSWDAKIMANILLPFGISGQITGNYQSPVVIAQGKTYERYSIDAGLRKSFMDKKWIVALTARDILQSAKNKSRTSADNFTQYSESYWGGRNFGVSITYMFGNQKQKKPSKQRDRDEMNGDMMEF